jgi:1-acyl-sn-glycerol-3-phosphate acyltransferase
MTALLQRVLVTVGRPFAWLVFRPQVRGRQHLVAKSGLVVCPNHLSGFDVLAVAYGIPNLRMRYMAKNQLFRRPVLGQIIRSLGAFPAHDGDGLPGGVAAAAALAAYGDAVVIFPEGVRRRIRRRKPQTGAARTALAAEVPLIPVALRGTDGWRRLRRWQIAFGPPVVLDDLRDGDPIEAAREATQRLWEKVTALEAELAAPDA